MSERLPRASLVVASLNLVAMLAALGLHLHRGPSPSGDLLTVLPALWLWGAALLHRSETGPSAHRLTVVGVGSLALSLGFVAVEWQRWSGVWSPRLSLAQKQLILPQFALAVFALALAVAGWWRRRQERADDAEEGA